MRPKAEALGYLEAKATATQKAKAMATTKATAGPSTSAAKSAAFAQDDNSVGIQLMAGRGFR